MDAMHANKFGDSVSPFPTGALLHGLEYVLHRGG